MTAEQRRQAIDFAKIRGTGMPIPSGMSSAARRAHALNVYFETGTPPVVIFWRGKNSVVGAWSPNTFPASSWLGKRVLSTPWTNKNTPSDSEI
jgi:hypothetical protein